MEHIDVLIAGGGPAGLATAIAAARQGFSVTLVDRALPPIDKPCGEGIMPSGLSALDKLGVHLESPLAVPFDGIRFVGDGHQPHSYFSYGNGRDIRRTTLHRCLMERAAKEGVSMKWDVSVDSITPHYAQVEKEQVGYRWLVCADGQNSSLRKAAGLDAVCCYCRRRGFRRHFRIPPWSKSVEVHWSDCGQIYITPISADEICVALITSTPNLRFRVALKEFPEIEERLRFSTPVTREQGAITSTTRLRLVQKGRVALVGEASGSVDAITGDGLSLAFQQAIALVDAMVQGDLSVYEASHRRMMWRPQIMARLLLLMDRNPTIRRRVLHALASQPDAFSRLLAVHTGALSPLRFGLRAVLSLSREFMTA
jgi:menaquinone-9 beta-reductase